MSDRKKRDKKYREKNKERISKYYQEHKPDFRRNARKYYHRHLEECREKNRQYYQSRKEELNDYQKNYHKNHTKVTVDAMMKDYLSDEKYIEYKNEMESI